MDVPIEPESYSCILPYVPVEGNDTPVTDIIACGGGTSVVTVEVDTIVTVDVAYTVEVVVSVLPVSEKPA